MTWVGRPLARANSSMSSVDELVASTQSGRVTRPRSANVAFFRSMFSNTASTTMSTWSKCRNVVVGVISAIVFSTCSAVILPFDIVTS